MSSKARPGERRGPLLTMLVAASLAMMLAVAPAAAQGVEEAPAYEPTAAPCDDPLHCQYPIDPGPEPPTDPQYPPPEPPTDPQYPPPYGYCQYESCGPPGYGGWEPRGDIIGGTADKVFNGAPGDKAGENADRPINVESEDGSGEEDYAAALKAAHSANAGGETASASEVAGDDGGKAAKDGGPKEETVAAEEEETVAAEKEETVAAEETETRDAEARDAGGEGSGAGTTAVAAREISETDGGSPFPILPVVLLGTSVFSLVAGGLLLGRMVR